MPWMIFSIPCLPFHVRRAAAAGQYHSGIIYFEQIHQAVTENDFAGLCDSLEEHQFWSREYIVKNLETVKKKNEA